MEESNETQSEDQVAFPPESAIAPANLLQAQRMAGMSGHIFTFMGAISEHIATHMKKAGVDLKPDDDPVALALTHAHGDRSYTTYCYALRSLNLLRSFAVLYQHALPDGTLTIARSCIENEAAALISAFGTAEDFQGLVESSQAWLEKHAEFARIDLGQRPFPGAESPRTWQPAKLFRTMQAIAAAGHYSSVRCEDLRWYHGYLSYLEGHADFQLTVLASARLDRVPISGFAADYYAANAAVSCTAWATSIAAHSIGVSDEDIRAALDAYNDAVPIPSHPA